MSAATAAILWLPLANYAQATRAVGWDALAPSLGPVRPVTKKAVNFVPLAALPPASARLMGEFFARADVADAEAATALYARLATERDDLLATLLAVTQALARMRIHLGGGEWIPATSLIERIHRLEGDRIKVRFNPETFDRWRSAGKGAFSFDRADRKKEEGKLSFGGGNLGGSLHKGYDIQAYTSVNDVPRVQINYRHADSEAEIDLDGATAWKWGFIPNPNHLTWENSDMRFHMKSYAKKFGTPGFQSVDVPKAKKR